MAVETTLICDECGRVIDAGKSAALVRKVARREKTVQRVQGQELCRECVTEQYPDGVPKQRRRRK